MHKFMSTTCTHTLFTSTCYLCVIDEISIYNFFLKLNDLPPGGIHSISLVAVRQGLSILAFLPSVVAGPVDPGMFGILRLRVSVSPTQRAHS